MKTTVEKLIELVESGSVETQKEAADILGVTRQRISQIVLKYSLDLCAFQPNPLIVAPCPRCGKPVERKTRGVKGFCSKNCANARDFCSRGHPKDPIRKYRPCLECQRRIVEVRTCLECGKPLHISAAMKNRIKNGYAKGLRHFDCYVKNKVHIGGYFVEAKMGDEYVPLDSIMSQPKIRWPVEKWVNIPPGLALQIEIPDGRTASNIAAAIRSSLQGKRAKEILGGKRLTVLVFKSEVYVGMPKEE